MHRSLASAQSCPVLVYFQAEARIYMLSTKLPKHGMQVDSIAVLISTINLLMTQDPPPRLDAYGHLIKAPKGPDPDDPFPESPTRMLPQSNVAPPVSDGWLFTAVGKFCLDYLQSPDSALAAESSRALLHLKWLHSTVMFPRLQVCCRPCSCIHTMHAYLHLLPL